MAEQERSESGQRIYRYGERVNAPEVAAGNDATIRAVTEHVEQYIGPVANVFHELVSDLIHLDLFLVDPTEERPFRTLITCGMSDRPMSIPIETPDDVAGAQYLRYAELMLGLPADWPIDQQSLADERYYWPLRWLKTLARLPHEYDSWLGKGHTIPNGDPAEPFAPGTEFCCWIVDEPLLSPKEFGRMKLDTKTVNFYSIVPLYEEEMNLKLRKGADSLNKLLDKALVNERIDPLRRNTAKLN